MIAPFWIPGEKGFYDGYMYLANWQGVPIRVEIGPRDIQSSQFVAVSRDTMSKETVTMAKAIERIKQLMDEMQERLFSKLVFFTLVQSELLIFTHTHTHTHTCDATGPSLS